MDRFKPRTSAVAAGLAACGLAATVVLSGCSVGQVSQMATQEPAVNGTSANVGPISLRNVHLRAAQSTDYVQPGRDVELLFVAVNNSPYVNDKLVSITSDVFVDRSKTVTFGIAANATKRPFALSRAWPAPSTRVVPAAMSRTATARTPKAKFPIEGASAG